MSYAGPRHGGHARQDYTPGRSQTRDIQGWAGLQFAPPVLSGLLSHPLVWKRNSSSGGAARCRVVGEVDTQLTAFFTRAAILASSAAVNFINAKPVGHITPSSRCAESLKPNVQYLVLNFCPVWKKQIILPASLA